MISTSLVQNYFHLAAQNIHKWATTLSSNERSTENTFQYFVKQIICVFLFFFFFAFFCVCGRFEFDFVHVHLARRSSRMWAIGALFKTISENVRDRQRRHIDAHIKIRAKHWRRVLLSKRFVQTGWMKAKAIAVHYLPFTSSMFLCWHFSNKGNIWKKQKKNNYTYI